MIQIRIDLSELHASLDRARRRRDMTWQQVATEIGCGQSTIARLARGHRPDTQTFLTFTTWLQMPAEAFIELLSPAHRQTQPDLLVEICALLGRRRDLTRRDRDLLEEVIESALRGIPRKPTRIRSE